jgi:hypothetical protein
MRLLLALALFVAAAVPAAADHDRCGGPYRAVRGPAWRAHACGLQPRYAYRLHRACARRCAPCYAIYWEVRSYCDRPCGYGWRRYVGRGGVGVAPLWSRLATTFTLDDAVFDRGAAISLARVVEPAVPVGGRFLVDCD